MQTVNVTEHRPFSTQVVHTAVKTQLIYN